MKSKQTVRKQIASKTSDRTQISHCRKTRMTCAVLQDELDDIGGHGTIPKAELNKLSKRIAKLDRTASTVLAALR
jgi:hypothetical protein